MAQTCLMEFLGLERPFLVVGWQGLCSRGAVAEHRAAAKQKKCMQDTKRALKDKVTLKDFRKWRKILIYIAQIVQSCPVLWKRIVSLLSDLRSCLLSSHSVKTVRDWEV